jgi:hypothetical protein
MSRISSPVPPRGLEPRHLRGALGFEQPLDSTAGTHRANTPQHLLLEEAVRMRPRRSARNHRSTLRAHSVGSGVGCCNSTSDEGNDPVPPRAIPGATDAGHGRPPRYVVEGERDARRARPRPGGGRHASCPASGTWSAPGSSSLRLSKRMNELPWARMSAVLGFQSSILAEPPLPRHWTLVVCGRGATRENSLERRDRGQNRGRLQAPRPALVPFSRDLVWLWSHVH